MKKNKHTILFVDDEPWLHDALIAFIEDEDFICISKSNMSDAWRVINEQKISSVVTGIIRSPGEDFPDVDSSETGFIFIDLLIKNFPDINIVCLSVIGDRDKINYLKKKGVLYIRKGETPLESAIKTIKSKTTGCYEV